MDFLASAHLNLWLLSMCYAGISFPDGSCSQAVNFLLDETLRCSSLCLPTSYNSSTVSWCNLYFSFHQIELASLGPSTFKIFKSLLLPSAYSLLFNSQFLLSLLIITVVFESARSRISAFYSITKIKWSLLYPLTDSKSWNIIKFHLYSVNMFILLMANPSGTLALYCLSSTTISIILEFLLSFILFLFYQFLLDSLNYFLNSPSNSYSTQSSFASKTFLPVLIYFTAFLGWFQTLLDPMPSPFLISSLVLWQLFLK